jgi:cellulose synthase/poly-beta-1,6-N-acetylglucosamine synthase-like glycosyltransferase
VTGIHSLAAYGPDLHWLVQGLVVILFAMAATAFARIVRGGLELGKWERSKPEDYSQLLLKSRLVPDVSTIASPPDATPESRQFVRRLLDLHFGRNEVVIVLDGPTPQEMEVWIHDFRLAASARTFQQKLPHAAVRTIYESRDPIRIVVVDKERGGPADAWNAGVNVATSPVIGFLEMDSDFEPMVLLHMIQPMLEAHEEIVAVCGADAVPPAESLPSRWATLESLRMWLSWGAARSGRNQVMPIPGSAVLVSRAAVLESGGGTASAIELVLRLHAFGLRSRKKYKIVFLPQPVSHARPVTKRSGAVRELQRRTARDQGRIARAFRRRRALTGSFGLGFLRVVWVERLIGPKLETLAYVATVAGVVTGWVSFTLAGVVFVVTAGMGIINSMAAVVMRELAQPAQTDPQRLSSLFWSTIPENLGYRQMRMLWLTFLRGKD